MPKRACNAATTMRAVVTIRSLESRAIASRSRRWIVTGTTARAGDPQHHDGLRRMAASCRKLGKKFGMAGMPESGAGRERAWQSGW